MSKVSFFLKNNFRTIFSVCFLVLVFYFSKHQSYVLFHTLVEMFSIVVAFAVFIVTWNSRKMQDNSFLHLVGISYIFIGALDLLHTLTYKGMNVIPVGGFPANQFWVATRMLEALSLCIGMLLVKRNRKLNSDLVFLGYFGISLFIIFLILVWRVFPVCFIEGVGQTDFKIYAEYIIILVLLIAGYLLIKNRNKFNVTVYKLLLAAVLFTIFSEVCFALYISNSGPINEIGHYMKLIAFFLIYKANVETGFIKPTDLIFKNLKESEEKYRTLAENLPEMVFRFDNVFQCVYANNDGILGAVGQLNQQGELIKLLQPILEKSSRLGTVQKASFSLESNLAVRFYAAQVIPEYGEQGQGKSFLVICQDVTELKQTEQQLQALNATKDKLFSIVAHDLKTPFTSLLTYSELIHNKSESLERQKIGHMASRMNASAKQAYALLENLLSWSSIQTGLLKPVPISLVITVLFEEVELLTLPSAVAKGIELNFTAEYSLMAYADQQMAATVLRNLVSNALKFSFKGSKVNIVAVEAGGMVLFSVTDFGTGIAEQNQVQLLEVGNRFSSPGTASESGTGLGLVLCREFVEVNGGRIWLESELGIGTTFYFSLPLG